MVERYRCAVKTNVLVPAEGDRRFYRVDPSRSRKSGGTGLGLSIVKHIVMNNGGQITLKSEPGAGSTFTCLMKKAEG